MADGKRGRRRKSIDLSVIHPLYLGGKHTGKEMADMFGVTCRSLYKAISRARKNAPEEWPYKQLPRAQKVIPPKPKRVLTPLQEQLLKEYKTGTPRRILASRYGIPKVELNMILIEIGCGA